MNSGVYYTLLGDNHVSLVPSIFVNQGIGCQVFKEGIRDYRKVTKSNTSRLVACLS